MTGTKPANIYQRTRFVGLTETVCRTVCKVRHPTSLQDAQLQTPMFGRSSSESRVGRVTVIGFPWISRYGL